MKISVIIPTYKPSFYLWECLDSLEAQSFPKSDFEVLLILNGCREPYNSQIKNWISGHPDLQVQYIQTDQGGVSNARNIALDNVKGEYVTFIDDDDFVSPTYLEELYIMATPDTVSLCYPYAFKDGISDKQLKYSLTDTYYCLSHKCNKLSSRARKYFSGPCMKLIPMSFIQGRRYDVRFKNGEDSLFMFLISDKIDKVAFTTEKAIYYRRIRQDSASSKKRTTKEKVLNSILGIREYTKTFLRGGYSLYFYVSRIVAEILFVLKNTIFKNEKD